MGPRPAPAERACPIRRVREGEMTHEETADSTAAEAVRRERFGTLPERIRLEDTVEEKPATAPDPTKDTYNPDEWLVRNCL